MMKNKMSMMFGAMAGIGVYATLNYMAKNKKCVKTVVNDMIDETAAMFE